MISGVVGAPRGGSANRRGGAVSSPTGLWHIAGFVQSHWFSPDSIVVGGQVQSVPDTEGLENLVADPGREATIGVWAGDGGDAWHIPESGTALSADGWATRASGLCVPTTNIYLVQYEQPNSHWWPVATAFYGSCIDIGPRPEGAWSLELGAFRNSGGNVYTKKVVFGLWSDLYLPMCIAWLYDGTHHRFWVNGVEQAPYDTYQTNVEVAATFTSYEIGGYNEVTDSFKGWIAENHLYLGALSDAQIVTVSNDMIARRGI